MKGTPKGLLVRRCLGVQTPILTWYDWKTRESKKNINKYQLKSPVERSIQTSVFVTHAGSIGLVYLPTLMVDFYKGKYTSPMDPMGYIFYTKNETLVTPNQSPGYVFFTDPSFRIDFKKNMGVSKNNGTPKSSIINYKPSILGYPYFWKHPHPKNHIHHPKTTLAAVAMLRHPESPPVSQTLAAM